MRRKPDGGHVQAISAVRNTCSGGIWPLKLRTGRNAHPAVAGDLSALDFVEGRQTKRAPRERRPPGGSLLISRHGGELSPRENHPAYAGRSPGARQFAVLVRNVGALLSRIITVCV